MSELSNKHKKLLLDLLPSYEILTGSDDKYKRERMLYLLHGSVKEQLMIFLKCRNEYSHFRFLIQESIDNKILPMDETTTIRLMNLVDDTEMIRDRLHSLEITDDYLFNEICKFEHKIKQEKENYVNEPTKVSI